MLDEASVVAQVNVRDVSDCSLNGRGAGQHFEGRVKLLDDEIRYVERGVPV